MYILIVFLPLLSAIISGRFGRNLGERGVGIFSSSCMVICWVISLLIFNETNLDTSILYLKLWKWFDSELITINFGFQFDALTGIMLIVITSISALVHIYSIGYMFGDPHIPRFMCYLSLFTFFMILLVTSDNYVQLFFGWEGVGLCSYLLINFWFTRIKANKAAIKAMLVNRVGDIGLVLAMFVIFKEFGSLEFSTVFSVMNEVRDTPNSVSLICIFLFLGAVGKSAQLGLHTWLPDAMEGPTPVSALIHAATMVTAGVFLIIRSGPIFENSPLALIIVTVLGALTAFFAATVGLVQNDLKKVIAYSTCSQLGYMVMVCGISNYSTSLFHLMNHAYFKALLFLSAGSVIHALADEQDMRKMGGLIKFIPFTYIMIFIGSLSLMGFPYLAGFYSKDLILELAYDRYYLTLAHWLGVFSALLTAYYSIRLIYLTFLSNSNIKKEVLMKVHESSWNITVPLGGLALGSLFIGYLAREVVIGNVSPPVVPTIIKLIPTIFSLSGAILAFIGYNSLKTNRIILPQINRETMPNVVGPVVYSFLNSAWQFNFIINHFLVLKLLKWGYLVSYRILDRGVFEIFGPMGISRWIVIVSQWISNLQSGRLYNYLLIMLIFVVLFIVGLT
uniref:NADH-ubiquinone oxidoreductase chain 5 n=1 Tax=Plakina trilopha TaxID=764034 RepID=E7DNL5_PLATI|nr:NADH dehydrogenase subunit 5 [Plakina trilopha]